MSESCPLGSSSYFNLLQRMFWRLPWLSHIIHEEHATAIQFLQTRGREQQYLVGTAERRHSRAFSASNNGTKRQDPSQLTLEL